VKALPGEIDLSVVVTLMDSRGQVKECLSSWTRGQTLARECYEVIVVGSGRESEIEVLAQDLLTADDRLLRFEAANELALHDFGAQRARGRWLFFTEAHCQADPDCLAALLTYLQTHAGQYAGACIRTTSDGSADRIARLEERWYQEGFAAWSQEEDWRKFTIRGTAVLREAYAKVGGFKSEYGCFAEVLLAAELDAGGYRLGYAAAASIKHYNSTRIGELLAYVREYREGEVAFRSRGASGRLARYFGWSESWREQRPVDRRQALACATRSLLRAMVRPWRPGAAAKAFAALETLLRLPIDLVSAGGASLLQASLAYAWARLLFAWPWLEPERRYRRYCRLWDAAGELARQRALRRQKPSGSSSDPPPASETLDYRPGEMPSGDLIGFHGSEQFEGRRFRWSSPLALVRLRLPPGPYVVRLDLGSLGAPLASEFVDLYLDGRLLRRGDDIQAGQGIFRPEPGQFRDRPPENLILVSGRIRAASPEVRALGVPVFGIEFLPEESAGTGAETGPVPRR
jgi:hypothetical protein